jgi:Tfp pilus assembly PilM family ATPase
MIVRDLPPGVSTSGAIPSPDAVVDILNDAVSEARVHERRCVAAISNDVAMIKPVTFPRMSHFERNRAAKYEAAHFIRYPLDECTVRLVAGERAGDYLLGIARTSALRSRVRVLRGAGLRPVGLDHETCAWRRVAGDLDCLIDIGSKRTTLIVFARPLAEVRTFSVGGETITEDIARTLGIERAAAEQRKRTVARGVTRPGLGVIVSEVADTILEMRSAGHDIRRIGLAGNGARADGLCVALERATGIETSLADFANSVSSDYPSDVMRAGAPDWLFSYAIALWSRT